MDEPILENVPGLIEALDNFIQLDDEVTYDFFRKSESPFQMVGYKGHILKFLGWGKQLFSSITPLHVNAG